MAGQDLQKNRQMDGQAHRHADRAGQGRACCLLQDEQSDLVHTVCYRDVLNGLGDNALDKI